MKWVLVTGGTGFIGTNLCRSLLEKGEFVIALDNHITSPKNQKHIFIHHPRYLFLYHDITQPFPDELSIKKRNIETIYHLACPTGVPNVIKLAEEMALTCSIGTKNVLTLALQHNADVIYTSSSEAYGDPQVFPQTEMYTGNVLSTGIRSPYEEGKRFSETLIALYTKKHHLRAKIARVFNTYGPYMSLTDTRVIPRFIKQMKSDQPLTVQGKGTHTRTFCYIDDLLDGLFLIASKGKNGEVYNIGGQNEISIHSLAKKLLSFRKKHNGIHFVSQYVTDHARRLPSLEKIHALGWKQHTSLEKGLAQTLRWYGL